MTNENKIIQELLNSLKQTLTEANVGVIEIHLMQNKGTFHDQQA